MSCLFSTSKGGNLSIDAKSKDLSKKDGYEDINSSHRDVTIIEAYVGPGFFSIVDNRIEIRYSLLQSVHAVGI